jgi:RNA polymerase primary sigma factor
MPCADLTDNGRRPARTTKARPCGTGNVTSMATISETPHHRAGRPDDPALLRAAQAHEGSGRTELVAAYMPLIGSVAHRYRGARSVNHTELMQEGVVGLLRALDRYDPGRETPFWAYASFWVRQAMQQLVAELTWPVVLSDRALRQLARARDTERRFAQDQGRSPSVAELAAAAGFVPEHLGLLLAAERLPRGLDEPAFVDRGTGSPLGETLSDPAAQDPFERIPTRDAAERLGEILVLLTDREQTILIEHYGLDGEPRTLRVIAARLGVSPERVRQIEQGALDKLRETCDATG